MSVPRVVFDTSLWIAALRSRQGGSFKLLSAIDSGQFEIAVSVPLVLEYEAVAKRLVGEIPITERDIDILLDYISAIAVRQRISYLWRPFLTDPDDDMILELAVNASCSYVITFNTRHFRGIERFGMSAITPQEFLRIIKVHL